MATSTSSCWETGNRSGSPVSVSFVACGVIGGWQAPTAISRCNRTGPDEGTRLDELWKRQPLEEQP